MMNAKLSTVSKGFDTAVFMAVPKPMLTEFGIHYRLESFEYTRLDVGCFEFLQRQLATIHCGLDDTHESYYNSLRN